MAENPTGLDEQKQDAPPRPADSDAEAAPVSGEGMLVFENKFFSVDHDAYFRLQDETGEPVLAMKYGGLDALLPITNIKREFGLAEGSHDAKMLVMVAAALKFVKVLHIGAELPAEVISGEASWNITKHHRILAQQRVTMQLVAWMSGDEDSITNPEELIRLADDPATKEKVNAAFDQAAEAMGLGRDRRDDVVDMITSFGDELAYIEALREIVNQVQEIGRKAGDLEKVYIANRGVLDNLKPVIRLLNVALKQFRDALEKVDTQTGEILDVLKNLDANTKFVRGVRDDLFQRLNAWQDIISSWGEIYAVRSADTEKLIAITYRFLAVRYLEGDNWTLFADLHKNTMRRINEQVW